MSIPPRTPPLAYVWLEARVLKVMKVPCRLKKVPSTKRWKDPTPKKIMS